MRGGTTCKNVNAEFPLGVLCVVTGVSGSGKSTLVELTLFPAVAQRLRMEGEKPLPFDEILGAGQVEDAMLVDQSPIGRTPRSNPVTYIKAFDPNSCPVRGNYRGPSARLQSKPFQLSMSTEVAANPVRARVTLASTCGLMEDVYMRCAQCQGQRYRREVLEVKHRGLSIAEVLELSVREAFTFLSRTPPDTYHD